MLLDVERTITICCLLQGDDLAAAACGLTTGYVHGKTPTATAARAAALAPNSPTSLLDGPGGRASVTSSSRASSGNGSRSNAVISNTLLDVRNGLSAADVDEIEHHMMQLLQLPGLSSADGPEQLQQHSAAEDEAQLQRKLRHAQLKVTSSSKDRLLICRCSCWAGEKVLSPYISTHAESCNCYCIIAAKDASECSFLIRLAPQRQCCEYCILTWQSSATQLMLTVIVTHRVVGITNKLR